MLPGRRVMLAWACSLFENRGARFMTARLHRDCCPLHSGHALGRHKPSLRQVVHVFEVRACCWHGALACRRHGEAEVRELKITKQPGLLFAPMLLMAHDELVEKHAARAGVPGLKAPWLTVMSGGANDDALLSGSVHITTSGVTNMLLLWSKTNGMGWFAASARATQARPKSPGAVRCAGISPSIAGGSGRRSMSAAA
jgi:hypothetical protein